MTSPRPTFVSLLPILAVTAAGACFAQAPDPPVTWGELAPVVEQRCVLCHRGDAAPLGLRLDSLEGVLSGSSNGPVVVAGDPGASELIRRIRGDSLPRMPMTGPPFLSDGEIARFEAWVTGGLAPGEDSSDDVAAADSAPGPIPTAAEATPGADGPVTWLDVAPILATRCAKCHTDGGLMGGPPEGYRLTSYESTLSTGDRARVIPGVPGASELVRRIRGDSLPRMPFDGPPYLDETEIELIIDWVAAGAPDAEGRAASVPIGAEVRLHGVLTGRWELDGQPLSVPPGARIRDNPRVGDHVEVRGVIDARGRVRVERIRVR